MKKCNESVFVAAVSSKYKVCLLIKTSSSNIGKCVAVHSFIESPGDGVDSRHVTHTLSSHSSYLLSQWFSTLTPDQNRLGRWLSSRPSDADVLPGLRISALIFILFYFCVKYHNGGQKSGLFKNEVSGSPSLLKGRLGGSTPNLPKQNLWRWRPEICIN